MRLRAEHKWASFKMSPSKWVEATKLYNSALESADQLRGRTTIPKNPRALMTTLGAVESIISDRVMTGNYKCELFWSISFHNLTSYIVLTAQKGTETFWREHCHAVQLLKEEQLNRKVCAILSFARCLLIACCSLESPLHVLAARLLCIQGQRVLPKTTRKGFAQTV
jgi:hypothetical protein